MPLRFISNSLIPPFLAFMYWKWNERMLLRWSWGMHLGDGRSERVTVISTKKLSTTQRLFRWDKKWLIAVGKRGADSYSQQSHLTFFCPFTGNSNWKYVCVGSATGKPDPDPFRSFINPSNSLRHSPMYPEILKIQTTNSYTKRLLNIRTLQEKRHSYSIPSACQQASHPINHNNTPPDAGWNVLALGFSSLNRPASHHLISSSVGVPCTSHFNIFHIIITRALQPI